MMVSIRCNENHFCFSSSSSVFSDAFDAVAALGNLLGAKSFRNRKAEWGARVWPGCITNRKLVLFCWAFFVVVEFSFWYLTLVLPTSVASSICVLSIFATREQDCCFGNVKLTGRSRDLLKIFMSIKTLILSYSVSKTAWGCTSSWCPWQNNFKSNKKLVGSVLNMFERTRVMRCGMREGSALLPSSSEERQQHNQKGFASINCNLMPIFKCNEGCSKERLKFSDHFNWIFQLLLD